MHTHTVGKRRRVAGLALSGAIVLGVGVLRAQSAEAPRVPAGTTLVVRTIDKIDSKSAGVGQTFRASLDEPLMVAGEQIAAKGSDAVLRLVEARSAGKLSGSSGLTVMLVSVSSGGQTIPIESENVTVESKGKGRKSALKIGGGAALGAALGGAIGGGKGAAIGAGAGAGAGTAAAMATGPRVQLAPETRLTFRTQ